MSYLSSYWHSYGYQPHSYENNWSSYNYSYTPSYHYSYLPSYHYSYSYQPSYHYSYSYLPSYHYSYSYQPSYNYSYVDYSNFWTQKDYITAGGKGSYDDYYTNH